MKKKKKEKTVKCPIFYILILYYLVIEVKKKHVDHVRVKLGDKTFCVCIQYTVNKKRNMN